MEVTKKKVGRLDLVVCTYNSRLVKSKQRVRSSKPAYLKGLRVQGGE